jgi:hypothetical protein
MTIQITRLRPDRITGEGYDWTRMGHVDDDGDVMDRRSGDSRKVGSVDQSGYVYDLDRHRIGYVDNDGDIYDEDRNRIGTTDAFSSDSVMVSDEHENRVCHAEPWDRQRYSFGWLSKAAGAGLILLINS